MQRRSRAIAVVCLAFFLTAVPASAQRPFQRGSSPAVGETYHVEVGGFLWNPSPTIVITSDLPDVIGDSIDFVEDLGIEDKTFRQLRIALRPGRKHKLRYERTPIRWTEETELNRTITFNGQTFDISLPVLAEIKWTAMRFAYEWDFIYRDRGFVGLVLEAKYTKVEASLENALGREFVSARAPIPAIGIIGRGYIARNVSITGEFGGFKLPERISEDYRGRYYDFDLYGTANFSDNFGAQLGYRSLTVYYRVDEDEGDLKMKGLYFGGVARF